MLKINLLYRKDSGPLFKDNCSELLIPKVY